VLSQHKAKRIIDLSITKMLKVLSNIVISCLVNKLKILHTADIHLAKYGDERWSALQTILEVGKKENIDALAVSGDLFNEKLDMEDLRPKIRQLFSNNGFDIVLISGNHDCNVCSDLFFGSDVKLLSDLSKPYEKEDVRIWGLPFEKISNEQLIEKLQYLKGETKKENMNILLYHGELLDAFFSRNDLGDEGEQSYMPIKLAYFDETNFNYVLAGHFHSSFDVRTLKNGGYFVYPGSPISVTKKETGRRSVNLFETGQAPNQYLLDTHHFEQIIFTLNPFSSNLPLEELGEILKKVHRAATVLLSVDGYFDKAKIGFTEVELTKAIEKIVGKKCGFCFEAKEIHKILDDELFKSYAKKLDATNFNDARKQELLQVAVKAFMEAS
jgi:exonuclease SbcD